MSRNRWSTIVGVLALSSEVNRVYAIAFSATGTKVRWKMFISVMQSGNRFTKWGRITVIEKS
jgi:hypothetical protein